MGGNRNRCIGDRHGHIVRGHCEGIHIAADLPRFIFAVHCQRQEFITRVWRESERNGIVHESGSGIGGFTCFHGNGTIGGIRHNDGICNGRPLRPKFLIAGFLCGNGRYRCARQSFIVKPPKEGVAGLRHVCGQCGSNAIGIAGYIPAVDRAAIRHQCDGISIRRPCAGEFHVVIGHGEGIVRIHRQSSAVCFGFSAPPAERVADQRRRGGNGLARAISNRGAGRNSRRAVRRRIGISIGNRVRPDTPLCPELQLILIQSCINKQVPLVSVGCSGVIRGWLADGVPSDKVIAFPGKGIRVQRLFFPIFEGLGLICARFKIGEEVNSEWLPIPVGRIRPLARCNRSIDGDFCLGRSAVAASPSTKIIEIAGRICQREFIHTGISGRICIWRQDNAAVQFVFNIICRGDQKVFIFTAGVIHYTGIWHFLWFVRSAHIILVFIR